MNLSYFSKLLRLLEKGGVPEKGLELEDTSTQLKAIEQALAKHKWEDLPGLKKDIENRKMESCKLLMRAFKLGPIIRAEEFSFEQLQRHIVRKSIVAALEDLYKMYKDIEALPDKTASGP